MAEIFPFEEAKRIVKHKRLKAEGDYSALLEHNLERLRELEEQGNPAEALSDAMLNLLEDAGAHNGFTYPVNLAGREAQYSRLLFQHEIVALIQQHPNSTREALVKDLAMRRGVTPNTAYRWHMEEMEFFLLDKDMIDFEPDIEYYFSLEHLHDLEAVMFMDAFHQ